MWWGLVSVVEAAMVVAVVGTVAMVKGQPVSARGRLG